MLYSKEPITTLDDYKGKKIRYASITNKQLLEALGAAPMLIPPSDAQDALSKGIVDGARLPARSGPCLRSCLGGEICHRAADSVGHIRDGDEPGEVQLVAAGSARHHRQGNRRERRDETSAAAYQAQEKFARELQTTKKGLQIVTLPPAEVAKMKELSKPIIDKAIDDLEKQGQTGERVLRGLHKIVPCKARRVRWLCVTAKRRGPPRSHSRETR